MQVAGDTLAVAAHDGLQLLDATGKSAWTTAAPGQRVIGGDAGRIYTTGPVGGLFAYDRASGKLRWKDEIASASGESISIAVTASSLYTQDRDRLVELDPKTGAERASLGVGRMKLSMSEKSPSVLACAGGKQLAAYSPAAPDLVPEKATITGKVTAEFLTPDVSVSIAGVTAKLDGDAFKLSLTGRGRYVVWVITSGVWHEAKTSTVELAGKGKYDVGTVDVEPEAEGD
jgi:hypothetical protein